MRMITLTKTPSNPSMPMTQPLIIGIGGPVGSGKTTLIEKLCKAMASQHQIAVITNDIYTQEDAAILKRLSALDSNRIYGVETGGCPHTAIRDDISANQDAIDLLLTRFDNALELIFLESGGDNLAASFSPELVEVEFYIIDVAGGEKIPRKGGPGITTSDLLIINKTDLAPYVGASLEVMQRDTEKQRGSRPYIFTDLKRGVGLSSVIKWIETRLSARQQLGYVRPYWTVEHDLPHIHSSLPPLYIDAMPFSALPMASADLQYDDEGRVAWDMMWEDFCDLALLGGPPHRGILLEPVSPEAVHAEPENYLRVRAEIARGLQLVTELEILTETAPGWIGLVCDDNAMASWMIRAAVTENVSVRREGQVLFFPVGPAFRLEEEIKNVITVAAKIFHYWRMHRTE